MPTHKQVQEAAHTLKMIGMIADCVVAHIIVAKLPDEAFKERERFTPNEGLRVREHAKLEARKEIEELRSRLINRDWAITTIVDYLHEVEAEEL